jgi:hypothetical protein
VSEDAPLQNYFGKATGERGSSIQFENVCRQRNVPKNNGCDKICRRDRRKIRAKRRLAYGRNGRVTPFTARNATMLIILYGSFVGAFIVLTATMRLCGFRCRGRGQLTMIDERKP